MLHTRWNILHILRTTVVATFVTFLLVNSSSIARADAVTDWNAIAVQTLVAATPPRPGPVIFLDLAIVQAAVHDAVQAIEGRFEPYHVKIPSASGWGDENCCDKGAKGRPKRVDFCSGVRS